jgi:hypothetical protein
MLLVTVVMLLLQESPGTCIQNASMGGGGGRIKCSLPSLNNRTNSSFHVHILF